MTAAAFVIYVSFALLAFVSRTWLQYRQTGDHGFRGVSGRIGPVEWSGGTLLKLGAFFALFASLVGILVG